MYFVDPQAGRKRRADLKNQLDATARRLEHGKDVVVRDAANRTTELLVETRQWIEMHRDPQARLYGPSLAEFARDSVSGWQRAHWSPAQRALAGAFGAGLAAWGYLRGGVRGAAYCALGGGLLARATANDKLSTLVASPARGVEMGVEPFDAATPRALGAAGAAPAYGGNGATAP
jgi:hypothetical protein